MSHSILLIGGTGTTGRSLVDLFKNSSASYRVMVRNPDKALELENQGVPTIKAALGDWESVDRALEGTDTVFLLSSPGPQSVSEQNGLIDRAKVAGVRKVVKISAVGAKSGSDIHLADWHGQIEEHLKDSGLDYVILRPHSFMQNTLMSIPTIKEQNVLYQSMGSSKIPMVDTRDIAKVSFECLTKDEFNNKTYEITGPEAVGYEDVAEALSSHCKKSISYVAIPSEAHNAAMKQAGVPEWLADDLTKMSQAWSARPINKPTSDFKTITQSQGHNIHDFARDYATYFTA